MRGRRIVPALACLFLILGPAAACSQSTDDDGLATAGGAGQDGGPAQDGYATGEVDPVKWASCLREHGLRVDDPVPPEIKPHIHEELASPEQLAAAVEACRQFNPNYGRPEPPPDPAEVELMRQFAACMREHGVPFDDPGPDGRIRPPDPGTATADSVGGEVFDEALTACNDRVPGVATIPSGGTK
jgi:hypothetical protein